MTVQNQKFLNKITTTVLTSEKTNICEGDLVDSELLKSLDSMQDCKSTGNNGLTKDFYKHFSNIIKDSLMISIKKQERRKS